ncbi:hypothetical protein BHE74_00029398 [Ensete ventricosum]|nr:hypothetical protein BHE74_00029398 [Ensete ventricosum]
MAPSVVSGAILVSSHDPSKGPRLDHSPMERGGARCAPLDRSSYLKKRGLPLVSSRRPPTLMFGPAADSKEPHQNL